MNDTRDEDELNNSEQISLEKLFTNIGEKIQVPFAARKRIIEICNERGIPDTEILSLETISEVWPRNESNQSKTDALAIVSFTILTEYFLFFLSTLWPYFFLNKSNKQFSVNAQYSQEPQIGMEMEVKPQNETDSVPGIKDSKNESQIKPITDFVPGIKSSKNESQIKRVLEYT